MVDIATVRRLALSVPDAEDRSDSDALSFALHGKGFAWTYSARVEPKRPRRPRIDVLAVRCPIEKKEMLVEAAPDVFFDDDHYRGFPAVLVRLEAIDQEELSALLKDAGALVKPKRRRRS
ncbi:MAG: MmcQ/YjbR family DNA-binding protein [Caulobacterales bacterium]